MSLNIVLFEPEIPQNTGNVARTCAATGSDLYLVRPLGFSVSDKYLKRAGLDYWDLVNVYYYDSIYELIEEKGMENFYFVTTKGDKFYSENKYEDNSFFVFGKETAGLPDRIHEMYPDKRIKIPMIDNERARSLNLSNSVNIVLYEALRQLGFEGLV
ncbi:tRNA (cytidine/uridine-2'-O-)-methyltransferase [Dethiosulfatibacter aminovorans DSM 17477]|uniref:Putative tRNA (cytidine(34)-2'-O)-methyltransferase n=1 Tax=Dethiosulfatibacter aminovorans DSM 17477 TaxID=1121476 RepID=A0A1M6FCH8_9FIRM|nr:tRNA (uridine(34)/cytosine(34)/5-carboxymethylaminomethyluridine(34)-2'-O)-methyltransferase TrmL [Dethiosulfatibacter aminovorans]SHI95319.1 tRNA (cytidine/uridine-2'-O-)-methyltransferase [Dethiosulfatibacter aminovorans DSM 17477]